MLFSCRRSSYSFAYAAEAHLCILIRFEPAFPSSPFCSACFVFPVHVRFSPVSVDSSSRFLPKVGVSFNVLNCLSLQASARGRLLPTFLHVLFPFFAGLKYVLSFLHTLSNAANYLATQSLRPRDGSHFLYRLHFRFFLFYVISYLSDILNYAALLFPISFFHFTAASFSSFNLPLACFVLVQFFRLAPPYPLFTSFF